MTTSEQINEIAAALSKAQGALRPAVKDAMNPAYKSKYADLAANVEAARKPLADNGLAVLQDATLAERGVSVLTRIVHSSGQWIEFGPLTVPLAKADAHGVGSATSYARRYALGAALGLVADDDDGNAAVASHGHQQKAQPEPKGFAEWWADLQAVAEEGSDALKAAWQKSKPDHRQHVATHHNAQWERLKAKASALTSEVPA